MSKYRALVHYHFKKGMEEKGLKFFEKELINKAQAFGCHYIELCQNGKDPCYVIGIGVWDSLEDARRFQSAWESKEKELLTMCEGEPHREFFKLRTTYTEKAKKAA